MAVHGGKFATVNGVGTVRNWFVNDNHELAHAVASNTAFGTASKKGVEEWSGGYEKFGKTYDHMPGDSIAFKGYTAPDNDGYGAGLTYSGTALIKQLTLNWNWQNGEILTQSVEFDGHLALTPTPADTVVLDSAVPDLPIVAGTKFQYSPDGITWTDWSDLVQATFVITNQVQRYVNSSTYVGAHAWAGRKAGPFTWTLSVTENNTDRVRFLKGDQLCLRLYVDATTFWLLKFARVKDFTGLQMNRETGAILAQTVALEMDGVKDSDGSLGTITMPSNTVWWPVAQS